MTDELMNSEYNNVGELFGIGELEKATRHMSPVKKAITVQEDPEQKWKNSLSKFPNT